MRLFHFSDDPDITIFAPRAVRVPAERVPGREWLNGPLVWAIDEAFAPIYLFPRDCPRIVMFRTPQSTATDVETWFGRSEAKAIAHIELSWLARVATAVLYRYDLPPDAFECLDDAGMWVSRVAVTPRRVETLADLPAAMAAAGLELRAMDSLASLRSAWSSSLHVSGIRLRRAKDW